MPKFTFTGLTGRSYTEARDSDGVVIGDVDPDTTRDLPEAPDHFWTPVAPAGSTDKTARPADKAGKAEAKPDSGTEKGA